MSNLLIQHVSYFYNWKSSDGQRHEFVALVGNRLVPIKYGNWSKVVKILEKARGLLTRPVADPDVWEGSYPSLNGRLGHVRPNKSKSVVKKNLEKAIEADAEYDARLKSEPTFALEEALKRHDWTYEYADDYRSWSAGDANWKRIQSLLVQVPEKVGQKLLEKYKR